MLNAKFQIVGLLVLRRRLDSKRFLPFMDMAASWSCDLDHLYKLSFPLHMEAPHEIWL